MHADQVAEGDQSGRVDADVDIEGCQPNVGGVDRGAVYICAIEVCRVRIEINRSKGISALAEVLDGNVARQGTDRQAVARAGKAGDGAGKADIAGIRSQGAVAVGKLDAVLEGNRAVCRDIGAELSRTVNSDRRRGRGAADRPIYIDQLGSVEADSARNVKGRVDLHRVAADHRQAAQRCDGVLEVDIGITAGNRQVAGTADRVDVDRGAVGARCGVDGHVPDNRRGVGAVEQDIACNVYIAFELQHARVGVDVQRRRPLVHTNALQADRAARIGRVQGHCAVGAEVAIDVERGGNGDRTAAAEMGVAVDRDAAGVDIRVDLDQLTRRQGQGKGAVDRTLQLNVAVVAADDRRAGASQVQGILDVDKAVVTIDVAMQRYGVTGGGIQGDAVTADGGADRIARRMIDGDIDRSDRQGAEGGNFDPFVDRDFAADTGNADVAGRAEVAGKGDVEGVGNAQPGNIAARYADQAGAVGRGQCQGVRAIHGTEVDRVNAVGNDRHVGRQLGQAHADSVEGVDGKHAAAGNSQFRRIDVDILVGAGQVPGEINGIAGGEGVGPGGQGDVAVEAGIVIGRDIAAEYDRRQGTALGRQLDRAVIGGNCATRRDRARGVIGTNDVDIYIRRDGAGFDVVAGGVETLQRCRAAEGAGRYVAAGDDRQLLGAVNGRGVDITGADQRNAVGQRHG